MNQTQSWRNNRILGRSHNNLGYLYRTNGHYGRAVEQYREALTYFKRAEMVDEEADTLNNLAFVMALLGRLSRATEYADKALEIRRLRGRNYPLLLSLNTLGYIHSMKDHPMWGARECRSALTLAEELHEQRGIGLSCIGLGFSLRRRGDQWKDGHYDHKEAAGFFAESEKHLKRAASIFSTELEEPIRQWEARNELGSLYCDWAWLYRHMESADRHRCLQLYHASISEQRDALDIAEKHGLEFSIAESLDDLAQAYRDLGHLQMTMGIIDAAIRSYETAESCLKRIETELVPARFHRNRSNANQEVPVPGEFYWLALGKAYRQKGIWDFRVLESRDAGLKPPDIEQLRFEGLRHFAISSAYFIRYWPRSTALERWMKALAKRIDQVGGHADEAKAVIREVEQDFAVDLTSLRETIDDLVF